MSASVQEEAAESSKRRTGKARAMPVHYAEDFQSHNHPQQNAASLRQSLGWVRESVDPSHGPDSTKAAASRNLHNVKLAHMDVPAISGCALAIGHHAGLDRTHANPAANRRQAVPLSQATSVPDHSGHSNHPTTISPASSPEQQAIQPPRDYDHSQPRDTRYE